MSTKTEKKKIEKQQEELLKYRNHYRGSQTTNTTSQDRQIKEKLRNLPFVMQNRNPTKRKRRKDNKKDL